VPIRPSGIRKLYSEGFILIGAAFKNFESGHPEGWTREEDRTKLMN
jgi:hypothetical protein